MRRRYRFVAKLETGAFPFRIMDAENEDAFNDVSDPVLEPVPAPDKTRTRSHFILEISSEGVTSYELARPAQILGVVMALAGIFGVAVFLTAVLPNPFPSNQTIQFGSVAYAELLGFVMLIPMGALGGAVVGRNIVRLWPSVGASELRVFSVTHGTLFQGLGLVSPQGPFTARVFCRRKRLDNILRLARAMPSPDHVHEWGPF